MQDRGFGENGLARSLCCCVLLISVYSDRAADGWASGDINCGTVAAFDEALLDWQNSHRRGSLRSVRLIQHHHTTCI